MQTQTITEATLSEADVVRILTEHFVRETGVSKVTVSLEYGGNFVIVCPSDKNHTVLPHFTATVVSHP